VARSDLNKSRSFATGEQQGLVHPLPLTALLLPTLLLHASRQHS
jgi:hypothetical protein